MSATFITIAVGLLAGAVPMFAQTEPTQKTGDTAEQTVIKLNRDLADAAVRKDKAFGDRVLLDDHVFINPGGGVEVKGENPASGPELAIDSIEHGKVRVWIHGDTAVLTGRAEIKGRTAKGVNISGPYRYMRVFVKEKGEWRLAATSSVRIAQPKAKPAYASKSN